VETLHSEKYFSELLKILSISTDTAGSKSVVK